MSIYKKQSKPTVALFLTTSLMAVYACHVSVDNGNNLTQTSVSNVSTNNNIATVKDFSFRKVFNRTNQVRFNTKSASNNLKPKIEADRSLVDNGKVINNTNSILTGRVSTTAGSTTISGTQTSFHNELKIGDKIIVEDTGEILTISSVPPRPTPVASATGSPVPPKFLVATAPTKTITNSSFKIYINKNTRPKNFGSTTLYPAIDLNAAGTGDDVLYYTSENSDGANTFAMGSDGNVKWENHFDGNFANCYPVFSTPTLAGVAQKNYPAASGKKLIYILSKDGNLYCINTDGNLVASIKIDDTFKNSVWVDADDPNIDYVYAASANGNLYRIKLDFTNPQTRSFSLSYSTKVGDTSFQATPTLSGSSLFLGGENGVLYEIIPNSGSSSRQWDLSTYSRNGSAKIIGDPVVGTGGVIMVPAGGYLFRIIGSTVTQSPLLELKNGFNSRNKGYGAVFNTSTQLPTGNIISTPLLDNIAGSTTVYVSNGNAVFQLDYSTIESFRNSANYAVSMSGRLSGSDTGLMSGTNGVVDISTPAAGGTRKLAMADFNTSKNSTSFINYFTLPISASTDNLVRYMPLNEFDSQGYPISGFNSAAVSDGAGNVYFTLNNGTVNTMVTP